MTDAGTPPCAPGGRLRVLASGSSGNCSVVACGVGPARRVWLIDAGLSPRRTRLLLADCGLTLDDVEAVILTHLDCDHWHSGWSRPGKMKPPVWVHRRHQGVARSLGVPTPTAFNGPFNPGDGHSGLIDPILMSHDDLGVAALRFDFMSGGCLGFATDLGHATPAFIAHMSGVDVMALESNYCPHMQMASGRPMFLKRRIMGGQGHLSNEQAARAAAEIRPRLHLVLLHLSRQCNTPERAGIFHAGADYALTIADQRSPTPWIAVPARERPRAPKAVRSPRAVHIQASLFSSAARQSAGA